MNEARATTSPRWAVLAGAALAAAVATGVPGLTVILRLLDHSHADVEALWAEIPLAIGTGVFGALQTRAQFRQSGRGVGVLLLLGNGGVVFLTGMGFVLHDAIGTTDGGAVLVLGGLIVIGAMLLQTALAGFSWWAIAKSVRFAKSQPEGAARMHLSRWLLACSAVHVALKLISGGSALFGAIGATVAVVLALGARRRGAAQTTVSTVVGSLIALLGFGFQAQSCSDSSHARQLAELPVCETTDSVYNHENDVLAKRARAVPHVADAATGVQGDQVTVYVLPTGGGPLDAPTQAAVEQAIAGVSCSFYRDHEDHRAEHIVVQGASYATVNVTATFHAPDTLVEGSNASIVEAVKRVFDTRRPGATLVRVSGRQSWSEPVTSGIGGWVDYRVGEQALQDAATRVPPGTVMVIGRVDVVVVQRDAGH